MVGRGQGPGRSAYCTQDDAVGGWRRRRRPGGGSCSRRGAAGAAFCPHVLLSTRHHPQTRDGQQRDQVVQTMCEDSRRQARAVELCAWLARFTRPGVRLSARLSSQRLYRT